MRKFGFTLAETLITLGIIGVVAAMTIPNLMSKLRYNREAALLKENYSILQQMMLRANEEGAMSNLPYTDNMNQLKEWFSTYMLPFVKVSKVCYGTKGCWSQDARNSIGQVDDNCSSKCPSSLFCGTYCMQKVIQQGYKLPVIVD